MPDSGPSAAGTPPQFALLAQLRAACAFLTRLPVGAARFGRTRLADAAWAFPLIGALLGALGGAVYLGAQHIGLGALTASLLALGAVALASGALHEDGLADTADGLAARGDRARGLAAMRDSRIGACGALALAFAVGLKAAALAELGDGLAVAAVLIAAHALARAALPAIMWVLPPARSDGLARDAGMPSLLQAAAALLLGGAIAVAALGMNGLALAAAAAIAAAAAAALCARRFGGHTGDTLGAAEQLGEIAALLAAAALL